MTIATESNQDARTPFRLQPPSGCASAQQDVNRDAAPRATFLDAMSHAVSGVHIVTTDGPGGRLGLTVSAMVSLSADPPMLLVCINRRSPICNAILANRRFAVNVLSDRQRHVADTFSGRPQAGEPYRFTTIDWGRRTGQSPRLHGAIAHFSCELESALDFGSHTVFVGRTHSAKGNGGTPLLYSQRAYGHPNLWNNAD